MSSGSSTEAAASFRTWHFFVIVALMSATVAVLLAHDTSPANLILTSLAIGGAGAVGGMLFLVIRPLTSRDDVAESIERLGARQRAALERDKALVLRSIKELEFDRSMGKVGEQDFAEMQAKLRARAIGLMRQLDEEAPGSYRSLVEQDVALRLGHPTREIGAARTPPDHPPALTPPGQSDPERVAVEAEPPESMKCAACQAAVVESDVFCGQCGERLRCPQCGAATAPEARFCKRCGARLKDEA
ncbi:MAG: zinc ribbon domain-containing protein [Vicinamibacterales bacterium]